MAVLGSLALVALVALLAPQARASRCVDELNFDSAPAGSVQAQSAPPLEPRAQLQILVMQALARSESLGAASLLAEAAGQDAEEVRATKKIQASIGGTVGPALSRSATANAHSLVQLRGNFNLSQLLYDGGRSDRLIDWRSRIADAARLGQMNLQEQLALNTVALAFERSRYRMTAQVWGQHVRKMGCLVEALEQIVAADKGRLSELVQAQKSMQQAELSQVQSGSAARQIEVRLRRLVGDGLPGIDGLASLMLAVPDLPGLQAQAERSVEIAQLDAQTAALTEYARSVEAGSKPQLSWTVGAGQNIAMGGNGAGAAGRSTSLSAGLAITVPLLSPGIAASSDAARKRAQAAALQRNDALQTRRARLEETHDQATSAFDRVRRTGAVLRDSERVRNFTLQQWQQLGRRSLFDVMAAESDHYNLRVAYVNALHDGQQMNTILLSLGSGLSNWLK